MTNEELASLIQEGNTALLPSLWEQVERFTAAKARDYFNLHPLTCSASGVTLEDLQQEAYFALLDAVRYFEPEAGHTFLTYMRYPLQNAFNALCGRRTQRSRQAPLNHSKSLYTPIGEEDITLADTLEDESAAEDFQQAEAAIYHKQLHNALEECLSTLPEIQEAAIRCRFYEGLTIAQTGEKIGLSRTQSRNREYEGLRALRTGKNRKRLEPFREDIISRHAYHGSFASWRDRGMSSTEYTVLKLEQAREEQYPPGVCCSKNRDLS